MTSKQVGMAIHKHPSAAHQMLNALVMDDLVHMRRVNHLRGGVHFLWHRTEVPIPKEFTTTDRCTVHSPVETSSLTAKALTKAMGGGEPPLAKPNLIHRIR